MSQAVMEDIHVTERIYARGIWTTQTALHIGGESNELDSGVDLVVLRDSEDRPYIPAASIAGACRNWLARALLDTKAYREEVEPAGLHVLFGDDYQSLLTIFDAPLKGKSRIALRDGVKIDLKLGVAEDRKKYDFEVVPAGLAFQIEFCLTLYNQQPNYWEKRSNENGSTDPEMVSAETLRSCFRLLLETMQKGELRLGAKTRRGLGAGSVDRWEIRRLGTEKRDALAAWLAHDPYSYAASSLEDLDSSLQVHEVPCFKIGATFVLDSSLLIRSSGEEANGPEFSHLSESERPLLPGTSITGAIRHRAEKIANTIGQNEKAGRALVERIFGYVHENDPDDPARASRFRLSEVALPGGPDRLHVQGRVSIDRFTGGALESALFDEAAYWPKTEEPGIALSLCLEDPECFEVGLLLLAFKDLWLGDLSLGGEIGVGRGILLGQSATITYAGHPTVTLSAESSPDATAVAGTDTVWLNHCTEQLRRKLNND